MKEITQQIDPKKNKKKTKRKERNFINETYRYENLKQNPEI